MVDMKNMLGGWPTPAAPYCADSSPIRPSIISGCNDVTGFYMYFVNGARDPIGRRYQPALGTPLLRMKRTALRR
jgi:hypothetical protein